MKKKDLKNVLKPLVRECLTEIFAEMKLETIVEQVIKKQKTPLKTSRPRVAKTLKENLEPVDASSQMSKEEIRQKMIESVGIDENTWANIYEDTAESENPILKGGNSDKPELVSEGALKESGLFKDYSKFI